MIRVLILLVVTWGASVFFSPQDPPAPKSRILLKCSLYSTQSDLWADVREVDPAFNAIGAEVAKWAKKLEANAIEDRTKAAGALKSLGLAAFGAIKEERDKTGSVQARWELDSILKEMAGDWPGPSSLHPKGRPVTKAEGEALRAEVATIAKDLDADAIEDRSKAAGALKSLGLAAFGAIKEERDKTKSDQARRELDSILKEMAGPSFAVPMGRSLASAEGEALRKRLTERKIRVFQQPFMSLVDGQPGSTYVGEEIPAGAGRRRVRLDADGKKILLEEKQPAGTLKFGFQMLIKPTVSGKDRKSLSLEIAITNTHIRRPIREIETPLGRVSDPEVIEIGVDLSPVLESGQHYIAGPFPAAEDKESPWWILIDAQIVKP